MSIVNLLRKFGHASNVLTSSETADCAKATEAAKQCMFKKARMFVLENAATPLLYSYQGDGTPISHRHRAVATLSESRTIHREG